MKKKEDIIIGILIILIVIESIVFGFLGPILGAFCYIFIPKEIITIIGVILILLCFKRYFSIYKILYVIVLLLLLPFSRTIFISIAEFTSVERSIEEDYNIGYSIKKINKTNDLYDCEYIYDVKLHNSNTIFQAGLCDVDGFLSNDYIDNFENKTLPKFIEDYYKKTGIKMKVGYSNKIEDNVFYKNTPYLIYEEEDEELVKFMDYLKEKTEEYKTVYKVYRCDQITKNIDKYYDEDHCSIIKTNEEEDE